MVKARKARAVGFNHVALEVGDIEEALAFYRRLFDFELRGKSATSAFIDLGDQFLALQKGRTQPTDEGRHFGLVVDDKDAVRKALADTGIQPLAGPFLDFLDKDALEGLLESWERSFGAAGQGAAALNRKVIDIAQRNINSGFDPTQKQRSGITGDHIWQLYYKGG